MTQTFSPALALSNIEYICLLMRGSPGQSQRWYLRRLHQYRFGFCGSGNFCAMYFSRRGRYRDRLFIDLAVGARVSMSWSPNKKLSPLCSKMFLTFEGEMYADRAAVKIGLL